MSGGIQPQTATVAARPRFYAMFFAKRLRRIMSAPRKTEICPETRHPSACESILGAQMVRMLSDYERNMRRGQTGTPYFWGFGRVARPTCDGMLLSTSAHNCVFFTCFRDRVL